MEEKKVAFIIIPPGQESFNINLTFRALWALSGVAFATALVIIAAFLSMGYMVQQGQTIRNLERDNQKLRMEHEKIMQLEEQLGYSRSKLNQIMFMLGVEDTSGLASQKINNANPLAVGVADAGQRAVNTPALSYSSPEMAGAFQQAQNAQRAMPSIWPAKGVVSQKFSLGGSYGKQHAGLDVAMAEGTGVVAAADGQVIMADWDNIFGHTIMIDHKNGYVTLYGHNSRLLVVNGATVKRGELVALSGNSGRSSAPHLHYEVRKGETPLDPMKFLTN